MPTPDSYFCLWLPRAMSKAGIDSATLATKIDRTPSLIRAWLEGRSVPRDQTRPKLAQALGVTRAELADVLAGGPGVLPVEKVAQ